MDNVFAKKLKELITGFRNMEWNLITHDTDLFLDLNFNSYDFLKLCLEIEKNWNINFESYILMIEPICTYGQLLEIISQLKGTVLKTLTKEEKLYLITKYACEKTAYYKKYTESRLLNSSECKNEIFYSIVPFGQEELQKHVNDMISDEYKVSFLNGDLLEKNNISAFGRTNKIYWSITDEVFTNIALWKLRSQWYHITLNEKCLTFFSFKVLGNRLENNKEYIKNDKEKYLSFNINGINLNKLETYSDLIAEFAPNWISGNPSVLYIIAQYKKNTNCRDFDHVTYIELCGEEVQKEILDFIKEVFPNVVISFLYTTAEVGAAALTCPCGVLHILEENVHVEILKDSKKADDEEIGNIVLTSYKNMAMPVLRYQNGDRGYITHNIRCKCGCSSPILTVTSQKTCNFAVFSEKGMVSPRIFEYVVEYVNAEFNNPIKQFQIIQKETDKFYVYLQLKSEFNHWKEAINECFIKEFCDLSEEQISCHLFFLEEMSPCEYTGVFSYFKNEM